MPSSKEEIIMKRAKIIAIVVFIVGALSAYLILKRTALPLPVLAIIGGTLFFLAEKIRAKHSVTGTKSTYYRRIAFLLMLCVPLGVIIIIRQYPDLLKEYPRLGMAVLMLLPFLLIIVNQLARYNRYKEKDKF